MIALIDIGNSRLKWQLLDSIESNKTMATGVFDYHVAMTKSVSSAFSDLFGDEMNNHALDAVYVASVASKKVNSQVIQALQDTYQVVPQRLKVSTQCGDIHNHYETQNTLGVDRWLAVVGARQLVDQGDVIVVDAGTAINIELLDQNNIYQGGAILPGFALAHNSLLNSTSKIKTTQHFTEKVIGKSTLECVNSGVHFGVGGAVDRIIERMTSMIQRDVCVVLTGGAAAQLTPVMQYPVDFHDPKLIFKGMLGVIRCAY